MKERFALPCFGFPGRSDLTMQGIKPVSLFQLEFPMHDFYHSERKGFHCFRELLNKTHPTFLIPNCGYAVWLTLRY